MIRCVLRFCNRMTTTESSFSTSSAKRPAEECVDEQADNASEKRQKTDESEDHSDAPQSSELVTRARQKRLKYAMLLCYCGSNYYGMQIQRRSDTATVEWHIMQALQKLRLITEDEFLKPKLYWFQRAARTDKGVSAVRQVCSLMLPLYRPGENKPASAVPDGCLTADSFADSVNTLLPPDIRIMGVKRATKGFDAKMACTSRVYSYTLPTYCFAQKDEDPTTYKITEERIKAVDEVLSMYKGSHNFYNFTSGRKPDDKSCHRFIMSCKCGEPFVRDDFELISVLLQGQSFMLHQIRKMIGLCVAILQGVVDKEAIYRAYEPIRYNIPLAPPTGLVLEEIKYDFYNKRFGPTHETITWNEYEEKVMLFRKEYIDPVITKAEKNDSIYLEWIQFVRQTNFERWSWTTEDQSTNSTDAEEVKNEDRDSD